MPGAPDSCTLLLQSLLVLPCSGTACTAAPPSASIMDGLPRVLTTSCAYRAKATTTAWSSASLGASMSRGMLGACPGTVTTCGKIEGGCHQPICWTSPLITARPSLAHTLSRTATPAVHHRNPLACRTFSFECLSSSLAMAGLSATGCRVVACPGTCMPTAHSAASHISVRSARPPCLAIA